MLPHYLKKWELTYKQLVKTYKGKHKILFYTRIIEKSKRANWYIQFICGNCGELTKQRYSVFLTSTFCVNCNKEQKHNYKDGRSSEALYKVWLTMKARCYNPNNGKYYRYGKRGIKVCKEWLNSYSTFKEWALKNGYKPNDNIKDYKNYLAIDRIDVNGDYSPNNCQWITVSQNSTKKKFDNLQTSTTILKGSRGVSK